MTAQIPDHVTAGALLHSVGRIGRAFAAHRSASQEVYDLALELESLEAELKAGAVPRLKLAATLRSLAELEYTPWRVATVVEELHGVWSLLGPF